MEMKVGLTKFVRPQANPTLQNYDTKDKNRINHNLYNTKTLNYPIQ